MTPAGQRAVLNSLTDQAVADLAALIEAGQVGGDLEGLLLEMFPELASQYGSLAANLSATWYEDAAPDLPYTAVTADPAPAEQMQTSVRWALSVGETATFLALLSGTLQRAIWDAARRTTVTNADAEGTRWARHARADACEFCRMLATRGAVYWSEEGATIVGAGRQHSRRVGGQVDGDTYHDHCHCVAVAVRPGQTYEPPSYAAAWEQEYIDASALGGTTKDILAAMRDAHSHVPASR